MVQTLNADDPCPCESKRAYGDCCGPLHRGEPAASAEALMRSRYTAYVLRLEPYLLQTWHPQTRPAALELADGTRWLGLKLLRHAVQDAGQATVEFVARYRVGGGSAVRLHERSRFQQVDGRWLYLDGEFPAEK